MLDNSKGDLCPLPISLDVEMNNVKFLNFKFIK